MGNHLFSIFPKWYGSEFISALGGALSLYLGISLAMFFELMEFFIVLFKNVWGYALKGRKPSEEFFLLFVGICGKKCVLQEVARWPRTKFVGKYYATTQCNKSAQIAPSPTTLCS